MLIREGIGLSGLWRVWVQEWEERGGVLVPAGEKRLDAEIPNLVTSAWKNAIRDVYRGSVTNCRITYFETGLDGTATSAAHTSLQNASFRKAITSQAAGGTGVVTTTTYIAPGESNVQIEEVGLFGTPTATSTVGSGTMVSRILYSRLKAATESLQFDYEATVA